MVHKKQLPLLYTVRERIIGQGFLAGIELHGRALAEQEDDGWWVCGITPGALADCGDTLVRAVQAFYLRLKTVLVDYAEQEGSFSSFKTSVEEFLRTTDKSALVEWEAARAAVRTGEVDEPGIPKVTDERPVVVRVRRIDLQPGSNVLDDKCFCIAA